MNSTKIKTALLEDIEELAAIGISFARLVAIAQERHHERARALYRKENNLADDEPVKLAMPAGASQRTIERYLKAVREQWAEESKESRPAKLAAMVQAVHATFLKAFNEGGPSLGAAVSALRLKAKIEGLEAPTKIEHSGGLDVKTLSPEQRRARIAELWVLRQKASAKKTKKPAAKKAPARKKPTKAPAKRARKTKKK